MPFRDGKSPKQIAKKIEEKINRFTSFQIEKALTVAGYALGGAADHYVPIDTSALINSRKISITGAGAGYRMTLGYYQEYALFLHGTKHMSPLWYPRPVGVRGKKTGGYNSKARPRWIYKGLEDIDINAIFKEALRDE